ncbi:MAG: hypothetical protein J6B95_07785 [Oscillospiraceae bacterium]|nr:hypothetical protein [Oscillospiraceae bacterium]
MSQWTGFSGNALKIIAAVSMLLDHIGVVLFPRVVMLRVLGRLALPIFAFMIAEGCRYTKKRLRYFLMVFGLGALCQIIYYVYDRDLYMCILVTFSLSILVIYPLQNLKGAQTAAGRAIWAIVTALAVVGVWLLNRWLVIDYGFWGCMMPVLAALFQGRGKAAAGAWDRKGVHVLMLGIGVLLVSMDRGGVQIFSLAALPLLMAYSGQRGKWKMKYFFYVFYPVHLAVLQGVAMFFG